MGKLKLKFTGSSNKIEFLEAQRYEKGQRIRNLEKSIENLIIEGQNEDNTDRVEEMECYSRQSNLILRCYSLGNKSK